MELTKVPAEKARLGRPQVLSDDERIAQILAAAGEVFKRIGYSGATMEKIAAEAGMSKRTLYQNFPDKLTLLSALLKCCDSNPLLQSLAEEDFSGPARDVLRRSLYEIAGHILAPSQTCLTRLAMVEAPTSPEMSRLFYENALGGVVAFFARRLRLMAERGMIRCEDPDRVADFLIGALIGHVHLRQLTNAQDPLPPACDEIVARIEALIALVAPAMQLAEA
ncbi:MAG: Transcriptional regulator, TetR family [Cereibacter sp.]|jgi:AcrR family transcriptional regulator|nr:Transcriptional regulator, TetR family [Cereibacter sp.]